MNACCCKIKRSLIKGPPFGCPESGKEQKKRKLRVLETIITHEGAIFCFHLSYNYNPDGTILFSSILSGTNQPNHIILLIQSFPNQFNRNPRPKPIHDTPMRCFLFPLSCFFFFWRSRLKDKIYHA